MRRREVVLKQFWHDNGLVVIIILVMVGGFMILRTRGDKLASTAAFDAQVRAGQPTIVEFYSNT